MNNNPEKTDGLDYTADKIQTLEDLEGVRKRPDMYIGDTNERDLHHCVLEIVDNCVRCKGMQNIFTDKRSLAHRLFVAHGLFMDAGAETADWSSNSGWSFSITHCNEGQKLRFNRIGDPSIDSVAMLGVLIRKYVSVVEIALANVRLIVHGLRVCVACSQHGSSLKMMSFDTMRMVWLSYLIFLRISSTQAETNGMISFDTSWLPNDELRYLFKPMSNQPMRVLDGKQLSLLIEIRLTIGTPWVQLEDVEDGCLEFSCVGGMSLPVLKSLRNSLACAPRVVIFTTRRAVVAIFESLLWAGIFMDQCALEDNRTPMIISSLCMLNLIFRIAHGTVDASGRVTFGKLPRQLDWPNGGDWGDWDEILREAVGVARQLPKQLGLTADATT